ncbi:MAG TPA: carboxypeptidase regulatory-like domain-containing protein [Candidatus Binataceae bacterium]|nr:carboxypeptidase regulatory-like domain-containing protein [Candidatus Binataceae bacterium]
MRSRIHFSAVVRVAAATAAIVIASLTPAASARAYRSETVKDGGTIVGTVKFDGTPPARKPVEISKDREVCGAVSHYDESLIVAPGGGIANAVVTIPAIAAGAPPTPLKDVKFDQKNCDYKPHVLALPAGSTVDIVNSDGILHSIRTESKLNPTLDMAQPSFKRVIVVGPLKYPELIAVSCDAHNWMHGWWFVAGNPYYAVTDASGGFTIKDVPPGTYTLKVWQEKLGTRTRKVTVEPDKTVTVDFAMAPGQG